MQSKKENVHNKPHPDSHRNGYSSIRHPTTTRLQIVHQESQGVTEICQRFERSTGEGNHRAGRKDKVPDK